ncbi:MAG: TetR/AcrR family transcriptional regulator [Thermaerobacter sp.]|nr:TetR/AcrR family transcriptional regulator [Thermaerobacter sp.]
MPEMLIRAAARLFARQGYDATSVSDIVQAADVTKGAMYYYFSAKEDLLFAIHQRFIEAEMRQAQEILRGTSEPKDRLSRLIVALVESIAEYHDEVTVFFREMHRLPGPQFEEVRKVRDAYQKVFEDTIIWGQREGIFRSDIEPRIMTLALFGQCNWTYTWMRSKGSLSAHEIGKRLAKVYLTGALTIRTPASKIGS